MIFLLFVFILGLLIVVHEAGHFFMARRLGVRVEEFAFGFGPKLWGWKKGDTEYRVCAIPLGGYVKMAGVERGSVKGASDEFLSKPAGHRALIVLMGPVVNYLMAFVCFVIVCWVGAVDLDASLKAYPAVIGNVLAHSAADKAGMLANDTFLKIDGKSVANWVEMQDTVLASEGRTLSVLLDRGGKEILISVAPTMQKTVDIFGREHLVPQLGLGRRQWGKGDQLVVKRYGFVEGIVKGAEELWSITAKTYGALGEMVLGRRSAKEGVTGLVGIFFIVKFAMGVGFSFVVHIVGVISVSLAIFNVLPLVPLDGGHLAFLGLEKLRGRGLSPRTEDIIFKAGLAVFIALAVFVFYVDFERIGLFDRIAAFFK